MQRHQISRIRQEARRRVLTVSTVEHLSPQMLRINFHAPALHDFASAGYDDHIKLFFADAVGGTTMRDFTPRRFDTARGTLSIDFALHEAGPATRWAAGAKAGDTLEIGGPRGSSIIPDDFDWYLLIGDETALPAIGRRIEELRPGVPVASFVIAAAGEEQVFATTAQWTPHWIVRAPAADDAAQLTAALENFPFPPGDGFIWIAAEAAVARAVKIYLADTRGHRRDWIKAAGYWKRGQADAHEKIDD